MKKGVDSIKIFTPFAILAIIFLILAGSLFYFKFQEYRSYQNLQNGIFLATQVSKVVHHLQKERGLSSGYIASKQKKFTKELQKQRIVVDAEIAQFRSFVKSASFQCPSSHLKAHLQYLFSLFDQLPKIRQEVDKGQIDVATVIKNYSKINEELLRTISFVVRISKNPDITQAILAYNFFLHLKERAGIERAIGTIILTQSLTPQLLILFHNLIDEQNLYQKLFKEYAPDMLLKGFQEVLERDFYSSITQVRNAILNNNIKVLRSIDPKSWFESMTLKIEELKAFEDYLTFAISMDIERVLSKTKGELLLYIALFIIVSIIFIATMFQIVRLMKKKSELRKLLDRYVISSTTDLKGVITDVSEAFCRISGYSREELIGKPHNIIRHPDMPKEAFKKMWATIAKGEIWEGEVKNRKKNGDYYWVKAVISPIYDDRGKRIGYTAVRQDITDKKKLEELNRTLEERVANEVRKSREKDKKMLQQSRLAQMGEMLSMIAHQWRQPLAAIATTTSALNMKANLGAIDTQTVKELTDKILSYTKHLSQTIDDFRDFFRFNKEKQNTTWKEMIQSVLGIVEGALKNKNIKIVTNIASDKTFHTHPNQIKQVILNLIKNAEDALLERGVTDPIITIEAKENILIVKDNAGGIPEEILPKIFDPYFSTKLEKDGTGLGLYMSKTIIEDHCKGNLWVYNDDEGAVFVIELPQDSVVQEDRKAS